MEGQLIRALERGDELLQRQEVATEGEPVLTSAGSGLVAPDDEMTSAVDLPSPPRVAHDARVTSPGDFEYINETKHIAEDLVAASVLHIDIRVQMGLRTSAQPGAVTPEAGPSGHAGPSHQPSKKLRPARPLGDRTPATARVLEYGNEGQE